MCEHKNSEIKFCKKEDGLDPVLFCHDCMTFVNEYLPKYEHSFYTHGTIHDIEQFLASGTDEEQKEKAQSLTYGLKSILDHYTCCDCGYNENYTFIFGKFINELRLLEYYFLKNLTSDIDPRDIKNHLRLFPRWLLDKLKLNKNNWTGKFRMKYNIYSTTDYNGLYYGNTNVISNFVSSKIGKVKSTFFLKKQHCNFVVQTTKLQCYERDFQNQEVSNVEQS